MDMGKDRDKCCASVNARGFHLRQLVVAVRNIRIVPRITTYNRLRD
jgi:hypothetical protein